MADLSSGSSVMTMLGGKTERQMSSFDVNPLLAQYARWQLGQLMPEAQADLAARDSALRAWAATEPARTESLGYAQQYYRGMRPGGTEEVRMGNLISQQYDAARRAAQLGLNQQMAGWKARMALGGNSPFADSAYARAGWAVPQMNLNAQLAAQEGGARLANAQNFLQNYNPTGYLNTAGLYATQNQYPLQLRGLQSQVSNSRAAGAGGLYDQSVATFFDNVKKNNAWDWMNAATQDIGKAANTYGTVMGAMGGMGGMGGLGGGGGGGGGGLGTPPITGAAYSQAYMPKS